MSEDAREFFAVCQPGLESWLADELRALGLEPTPDEGGCSFSGDLAALYAANLRLRIATRVLARVTDFHAGHFIDLEKHVAEVPWEDGLPHGCALSIDAVSYRSKLYHEGAIAERVGNIIGERIGARPAGEDEVGQTIHVRMVANHCTVSLDSSGELLHRRGYRQELTKATLRETLAASLVAFSGWDKKSALLDPMCGSGTIAIEAAMLARNIAPGRNRKFAFMDWPDFDKTVWRRLLLEADTETRRDCPPIYASDRDAGAIEICKANAKRAGVLSNITFTNCALSSVAIPAGPLQIVTNPPYGERIEGDGDLRNLYAALGNYFRSRENARLTFISNNPKWTGNTGCRCELSGKLSNGSIPIRFTRALDVAEVDDEQLLGEAGGHGFMGDDFCIVVDVEKQEARVWRNGEKLKTYSVSTARLGMGEVENSNMTPRGWHKIAERIGGDQPLGAEFKSRVPTGRVLAEDEWQSPSITRDVITTRILWLRGIEDGRNSGPGVDTHARYIYFHGTAHEELIGHPASAGCVRLKNRDIAELFDLLGDTTAYVWLG